MAGLRKILLVEDNVELRSIYELFLKQHEFDVAVADNGREALDVAKKFRPDIVFIDIMMPEMDGFKLLKLLRHDESYHCTKSKLLIFTNLGDPGKVSASVREDMDGYVIKAEIELPDLLDIIKSLE